MIRPEKNAYRSFFAAGLEEDRRCRSALRGEGGCGSVEQDLLLFQAIQIMHHQIEGLQPPLQQPYERFIGGLLVASPCDLCGGFSFLDLHELLELLHAASSFRRKRPGAGWRCRKGPNARDMPLEHEAVLPGHGDPEGSRGTGAGGSRGTGCSDPPGSPDRFGRVNPMTPVWLEFDPGRLGKGQWL